MTRLYWIEGIATAGLLLARRWVGALVGARRTASADAHHRHGRCRRGRRSRPARRRERRPRSRSARSRVELGVRCPRGVRTDPARVHFGRIARAAHATHLDSRLRRAAPCGGVARRGRNRPGRDSHRTRGRAHGWPRRQPACRWRVSTNGVRSSSPKSISRRSPRTQSADARAVEPDRPITLSAPSPVHVVGDETTLRQVFANLLANVREHTPPSTAVEVRVTATATGARIDVIDDGPGIDERRPGQSVRPVLAGRTRTAGRKRARARDRRRGRRRARRARLGWIRPPTAAGAARISWSNFLRSPPARPVTKFTSSTASWLVVRSQARPA